MLILSAGAFLACERAPAPPPAPPPTQAAPLVVAPPKVDEEPGAPDSPSSLAPSVPLAIVTDTVVLRALEARGFDLHSLLGGPQKGRSGGAIRADNKVLSHVRAFADIARTLKRDVESVRATDKLAGEDVARFSHRLFDIKRLADERSHFELIALVNRLDRKPFHSFPSERESRCGEVRLIYRLAYETEVFAQGADPAGAGKRVASRLPLTIGVEFAGPSQTNDPDCRLALRRFSPPEGLGGEALAEWISGERGPLQATATPSNKNVQVVVNLQVVRWPSTVHPQMAGHVEYALRAFRPNREGGLSLVELENTPDVQEIRGDRAKFERLLALLRDRENLRALDAGTLKLPAEFLADKAVSVAPRGFSRRANRPYKSLFGERDFAGLSYEGLTRVRSPASLLRRLDDMTCVGCHHARSVAGFHLLGEDGPESAVGNAMAVPFSPHVEEDLIRRRELFLAVSQGEPGDYSRPFAERSSDFGGYGAHCGLGGEFPDWTCDAGYTCDVYDAPADDRDVGICLPVGGPFAGDPCEVGTVRPHQDGRRDRVENVQKMECVNSSCNANSVGFPGGVCRSSCQSLGPHGRCGELAVLGPFNACLARHEPFTDCLTNHAAPAGLRACGPLDPCRDDYVCSRTAGTAGVCIPPYFLFQLRVDGHP